MSIKKTVFALIIATCLLVIEFKIAPIVSSKLKLWKQRAITPVEKTEQAKFDLIAAIRTGGMEIISGPFWRAETGGFEIALKTKGQFLKVLFSSKNDPRSQLASLQLILKNARMREEFKKGNLPKLIDLTGDKPYVSF